MITPRPKRWSITIGGTFPRRNPGMLTDLATSAYALSMLGLRSAKGTSTVILTRVGLNCSTVLGTLLYSCNGGAGRNDRRPRWLTLSRGNPTRVAQADQNPHQAIPRQSDLSESRCVLHSSASVRPSRTAGA